MINKSNSSLMESPVDGICMVEPYLKDYLGHDANYAKSIYHAVVDNYNIQFRILGNIGCLPEIKSSMPIIPVFSKKTTYWFSSNRFANFIFWPLNENWRFYRDISVAPTNFLNERWVLFRNTAFHTELFAWAFWIRRMRPENAPVFVFLFRLSLFQLNKRTFTLYWFLPQLRLLERLARRYRICLVTDSTRLADEFSSLTWLPMKVLPIPHTSHSSEQNDVLRGSSSFNNSCQAVNMVSLGSARMNKGFDLLVSAIVRLHDKGQLNNLIFTLQIHYGQGWGPDIPEYINTLKKMNLPQIRLIENVLNEDAYFRMLSQADVVLLPYRLFQYKANTSGPFAEALAAGKPVITTEGTWMSEQLKEYGAGLTFQDGDIDGLMNTICRMRDMYQHYKSESIGRKKLWSSYHNPNNFIIELLSTVSHKM